MKKYPNLLLLDPISAIEKLLKKTKCHGMIIGGVAASLLGKPRFTADVDCVLIPEDREIQEIFLYALKTGFVSRIKNAVKFAQRAKVLLLIHKKSGIYVDISIGFLPFEKEAVERSKVVKIDKVHFRIPTAEDMIIFKGVAHRPRDMEDIRAIIEKHPILDRKRINRWLKDFADTLEMPEICEDVINLL